MQVYCPVMPVSFDNIVQHIFHQPSLQSVTVDELERMTQRHPAFAAAHFLLLRKMQDTQHSRFDHQLQKTALYFNNPLWLQYLLSPDRVEEPAVLDHPPFIETKEAIGTEPPFLERQGHDAAPEQPIDTPTSDAAVRATASTEIHFSDPAEALASSAHSAETIAASSSPVAGNEQYVPETSLVSAALEQIDGIAPPPEATTNASVQADHPSETVAAVADTPPAPTDQVQVSTAVDADGGGDQKDADATESTEVASSQEPIQNDKPLLRTILEVPAAKDDLLFEPYHTVDYFASQGISLSKAEATEPRDHFGRQLRSFTEWLKTMKRLPQASIDKMLTEKEDSRVTADAVHSLENKEVITEAMAEVYEKQGLNEKAAAVYRKLSLQNPSKSAYFAAKIEALKL